MDVFTLDSEALDNLSPKQAEKLLESLVNDYAPSVTVLPIHPDWRRAYGIERRRLKRLRAMSPWSGVF